MLNTVRAIVHDGRIELLEKADLREGTPVLVTLLTDEDALFWMNTSQTALDSVWGNDQDDIYAQLLQD